MANANKVRDWRIYADLAQSLIQTARKLYLGDWPLFGEWFDRWVYAAKSLADFQSPKYKAIAVAMAPMNQNPQPQARTETNEPRDAQERERRAANDYLKLVKG